MEKPRPFVAQTGFRRQPALRKWRWPPLQPYNGFTSEERIRGWQLIWLLIDLGLQVKPTTCSMTGSNKNIGIHSENYYEPWNSFPISAGPHSILHRRFRYPQPWLRLVEQHAVTSEEWFCHLKMEPIDLAAELRAQRGREIADIFARAPLPEGITIPRDQVYCE
jgi:hypothetical protein